MLRLIYAQASSAFSPGTYEPRTIFHTVAEIALDIYRKDSKASFFFVGAADTRDRPGVKTRRYNVYVSFVNDLGIDHLFEAHLVDAYSMCVLLNRRAVPDMDAYMQQILDFIAE